MTWITMTLKVPDHEPGWIALVNMTPDAEAELIGYVDRSQLEGLVENAKPFIETYEGWLKQ